MYPKFQINALNVFYILQFFFFAQQASDQHIERERKKLICKLYRYPKVFSSLSDCPIYVRLYYSLQPFVRLPYIHSMCVYMIANVSVSSGAFKFDYTVLKNIPIRQRVNFVFFFFNLIFLGLFGLLDKSD